MFITTFYIDILATNRVDARRIGARARVKRDVTQCVSLVGLSKSACVERRLLQEGLFDNGLTKYVVSASCLSPVARVVSKTAAVAHFHIRITINCALRENRPLVEVLSRLVTLASNLKVTYQERSACLLSIVLLAWCRVGWRALRLI